MLWAAAAQICLTILSVCMHVYMYACMHVCMYACYLCIAGCTCQCMFVRMHVHMNWGMHVRACLCYVCMNIKQQWLQHTRQYIWHACIHMRICIGACVYVHSYMNIQESFISHPPTCMHNVRMCAQTTLSAHLFVWLAHMHVSVCELMHARIYCMHVFMHVSMYACIYPCIYVRIQSNCVFNMTRYTCIHMYMHTYYTYMPALITQNLQMRHSKDVSVYINMCTYIHNRLARTSLWICLEMMKETWQVQRVLGWWEIHELV
jgi:hypothetical protein